MINGNEKRFCASWVLAVSVLAWSANSRNSMADEVTHIPEAEAPSRSSQVWPEFLGAQYTWIRQRQSGLSSPYAGPLSLDPNGDLEATHTIGLYFGWSLTRNAQAYLDIEKFMGAGVSGATGLGGLTNGDVIRQGGIGLTKRAYVARRYLRYVVPLSDETTAVERAQDQVAGREATPGSNSRSAPWHLPTTSTRIATPIPLAPSS